jgi:hypothetical protein
MEATAEKLDSEVEKQGIMAPPKKAEPAEVSEEDAPYEGMAELTDEETENTDEQPAAENSKPETPKKKEPIFVSSEDLLRAETANQRKLIAAQQITILQMQINDAVRRSDEATQEVNALQKELGEKYEVDFSTHDIRSSDGMVIPKNPATAAFTRRLMGQ